jgi:hypothetical protein
MKSNTIKISDDANRKIKILMARNDLNFSEAVEYLAMLIPVIEDFKTNKVYSQMSCIQMHAFYVIEYTQEIKDEGYLPTREYFDYIGTCIGMMTDDLVETGRLVSEDEKEEH